MAAVTLHVYDISMGAAAGMSQMLLGRRIELIPHTGVVVEGTEYFFGGGIQALPHRQVPLMFGLQPVERLPLGATSRSKDEMRAWLRSVSHLYSQATYDLFANNCNHFSDAFVRFLLPGGPCVPPRIMDVPALVLATPLGAMLGQMMRDMNDRMGRAGGGGDPFAALGGGVGGGGALLDGEDGVGGGGAGSTAAPPAASSAAPAPAPPPRAPPPPPPLRPQVREPARQPPRAAL